MIRADFLSPPDRAALLALMRDGSAAHRLTRRANALLLLDDGLSCEEVAKVLYLDDDTVRGWAKLYGEGDLKGLMRFESGGSASHLSQAQEEGLKGWIAEALPRSTRQVGAYIEQEFGVVYESRAGLIALLHRLGLEYHKPEVIGRKLDAKKQQAFIAAYNDLLNSLGPAKAALFVDAVHPTHAARPVGCWAPAEDNLAIEQTSGRQRLNIHGAIELEIGKTAMIDVETVDAASLVMIHEGLARASRFVAEDFEPNGSLMRIRRRVATPEADGGAHGPAHGSSSAASARIVRDDEVQPTASDRGLRPPRADAAPQLALDAGGRAAIDDAKDGDGNRR